MVTDAIKRNEANGNLPEIDAAIRHVSSAAYGAGSETVRLRYRSLSYDGGNNRQHSVLRCLPVPWFFPEAQRKAQREIDDAVGTDRLPSFSDRPSLPYVDAFLREVERWHPVGPVGLPHATAAKDMYEGMYIPKGATLFPLMSAIFRHHVYQTFTVLF